MTLKKTLLLLLSCICFSSVWGDDTLNIAEQKVEEQKINVQEHKPKVALVLAGGGAKGLAHIAVIKVLEEAGLPIDIVVGNSMGSIVGGLYAIGYDGRQLDSVAHAIDWVNLLLDAPDYGDRLLTSKKMSETYQLRIPLAPVKRVRQGGLNGFIDGRNIGRLLAHLTEGIDRHADFNQFPRPFACNATEVRTGSIYEFHSGNLARAMRASMAIPGVFTPVKKDSLLLVDGFVTNNYPVDVARRMGADIIVGVDLVSQTDEKERYDNLTDLMTHLLELKSTSLYDKNIKDTEIYIDVDVTGYSSSSFGKEDIDSLIKRGDARAREFMPQIERLRDSLLSIGHRPYKHYSYSVPDHSEKDDFPKRFKKRNLLRTSSLGLGARFDNDEYASVHINPQVVIPTQKRSMMAELYARLGLRMKGALSFHRFMAADSRVSFSYSYEHGDLQFYNHGERAALITSHHQKLRLLLSQEWNKIQYTFGARHDWHKYVDVLLGPEVSRILESANFEHYFSVFGLAEFNSLNSMYFPTSGTLVNLRADLITDNFISYNQGGPLPIVQMNWQTSFLAFSSRFSMSPHIHGRAILTDVGSRAAPLALHNMIGGLESGMKTEPQIVSAGISDIEFINEDGLLFIGLDLQQRIGSNHYIKASIDGGAISNTFEDIIKRSNMTWGTQLGYSYDTGAGPLSLTGYWSERTHKFSMMFNIGFYF